MMAKLLDALARGGEAGGHRIDEVAAMVAAGGFCNGRGRAGEGVDRLGFGKGRRGSYRTSRRRRMAGAWPSRPRTRPLCPRGFCEQEGDGEVSWAAWPLMAQWQSSL